MIVTAQIVLTYRSQDSSPFNLDTYCDYVHNSFQKLLSFMLLFHHNNLIDWCAIICHEVCNSSISSHQLCRLAIMLTSVLLIQLFNVKVFKVHYHYDHCKCTVYQMKKYSKLAARTNTHFSWNILLNQYQTVHCVVNVL